LGALYQQASLFVYPSLYEGFGIPPLEAMSFNCPVVCSNTSSIPEVVGNAAVQFNPHDPDLRANLLHFGRARLEAFSWQQCAAKTLEVYRKVLQ
jgi:glycosyltransferase involved in cell wall biosynthesis